MPFIALLLVLVVPASHGQDENSETSRKDSYGIKLDQFHDKWSQRILGVANNVDSVFGNERMDEDAQETRVRLRLDYTLENDQDNQFRVRLSAKISLPQTNDRWSLIIGGDDERDEFQRNDDSGNERNLSVRFDKINNLNTNLSFDFGLRRPDDTYRVFGRARHRKSVSRGLWITRLDNKVYYYNSFGWEYDGILDFDRLMPPSKLFRSTTRFRWFEDDERCNGGWCPEQHFYLYQRFKSPKHAIAYEWQNFFETEPEDGSDDYLEGSFMQVRYRRSTSKRWLFWEITPGVTFRRENDYDGRGFLLLRLEGIFGYQPYRSDKTLLDFGPEMLLDAEKLD